MVFSGVAWAQLGSILGDFPQRVLDYIVTALGATCAGLEVFEARTSIRVTGLSPGLGLPSGSDARQIIRGMQQDPPPLHVGTPWTCPS